MKKTYWLFALSAFLLFASGVSAQGPISDTRFKEQLLQDTLHRRDQLMSQVILSWRKGDPQDIWMTSLIRMTKICLDASLICGVPDELLSVKRDSEFGPADLILFMLNREGVDTNLEVQFQDRRFTLYMPTIAPVDTPDAEPPTILSPNITGGGPHADARY